jgi:hypothetical protein
MRIPLFASENEIEGKTLLLKGRGEVRKISRTQTMEGGKSYG